MDTDPNPFRESPDDFRSSSSTEAPSSDTQDVTSSVEDTTGSASSMSVEDLDLSDSSPTDVEAGPIDEPEPARASVEDLGAGDVEPM